MRTELFEQVKKDTLIVFVATVFKMITRGDLEDDNPSTTFATIFNEKKSKKRNSGMLSLDLILHLMNIKYGATGSRALNEMVNLYQEGNYWNKVLTQSTDPEADKSSQEKLHPTESSQKDADEGAQSIPGGTNQTNESTSDD